VEGNWRFACSGHRQEQRHSLALILEEPGDGAALDETKHRPLAGQTAGQRADGGCGERPDRGPQSRHSSDTHAGALHAGDLAGCHRMGHGADSGHRSPMRHGLCLLLHPRSPRGRGWRLARHRPAGGLPGHGDRRGRAGRPFAAGGAGVSPPVGGASRATARRDMHRTGSAASRCLQGSGGRTRQRVRGKHDDRAAPGGGWHCIGCRPPSSAWSH
jgi:hypothetical protein